MTGFWRRWRHRRRGESRARLGGRYQRFQHLIEGNNRVLDLIADAGEKSDGDHLFDRRYLESLSEELALAVRGVVYDLNAMADNRYGELVDAFERICHSVRASLTPIPGTEGDVTLPLEEVDLDVLGAVGAKLATLGELRRRLGLRVPDGFIATTTACRLHFEAAGVPRLLASLDGGHDTTAGAEVDDVAKRVREAIVRTSLPDAVARALHKEARRSERARCRYAVRSSAIGEDGEHSFAGLHATLLQVPSSQIDEAYRHVLASLFSTEAIRYRAAQALPVGDALMAVGFLTMVPARSSGVIHTVNPMAPGLERMTVSAAWGLGPTVVEGSGPSDAFELSRDPVPRVIARQVVDKASAVRPREDAGTEGVPVPPSDRARPALSDAELSELGQVALRIEQHAGQHQEIEWAIDPRGELVILQARMLRVERPEVRDPSVLADVLARQRVLLRDAGVIACGGVGAGRVAIIGTGVDADAVPPGAVLVAHAPSPHYAPLLAQASAVITTIGSPTGHLATVAREYRVPMVVAAGDVARVLQPGMDVTVDAEENVVYEGLVHELVHYHLSRRQTDADFEEYRALRRLLRRIAPLNLTDPAAETFRARNCRTCHDVVRFAHEMAVRELMEMPGLTAHDRRRFLRRVRLPIPLDLDVLDLGGGLGMASEGTIPMDAIASAPLAALLGPLCASWRTEPVSLDMQSFLASATRSLSMTAPETSQVRPNLAVVTHDYLNLHLHLGYHYNMVDCRLTDAPDANYLYFRFHGGVTELTRRSRRARTIAAILQAYDFGVETKGDMVIGRLRGVSHETLEDRLRMVGRLIGYTRQLDVLMRHEGTIQEFTHDFCAGATPTDAEPSAADKPAGGGSSTPVA